MKANRKLRIALECRIDDTRSGVGSAIVALAHALSESEVTDQEYTFIVYSDATAWLEPHIFGPCRLAGVDRPRPSRLKNIFKPVAPLRAIWKRMRTRLLVPPRSDGYVESEHFDVVHFVTQMGYITSCPTIYQPHDLQHLHYPEFFSKEDFDYREKSYRVLCERATFVCVHTEWCKRDVIEKLGIAADKIAVVKWGCVLEAYERPVTEDPEHRNHRLNVPPQFFLYPAVTWPHKNHQCIIRAVKLLLDKYSRNIHVCFTGQSTEYRSHLEALAEQLDVTAQIHYLGFVTTAELQALLAEAVAMIYPSKFEGFGLPILEAFRFSLPVICARSSCLPEVAQDAAIFFDPDSPEQLASCILDMLDNQVIRRECVLRGHKVLSNSSFKRTAAEFQNLYRRVSEIHGNRPAFNIEDDIRGRERVEAN